MLNRSPWLIRPTGNLMLAIEARSFNNYFYLQSNNANHPARFIGNKVTGILFENKVDYASMNSPMTALLPSGPAMPGFLTRTVALPSVPKIQRMPKIDFPALYTIALP